MNSYRPSPDIFWRPPDRDIFDAPSHSYAKEVVATAVEPCPKIFGGNRIKTGCWLVLVGLCWFALALVLVLLDGSFVGSLAGWESTPVSV